MCVTVQLYGEEHIPFVKAFNERLRDKGEGHRFPESHIPDWLPKRTDSTLHQEYYVLANHDFVRGGYILKHQDFYLHGCTVPVANMQSPISEGTIDPKFALIGTILARDVLRRAPVIYTLGMGGYIEPITRFLRAMHWKLISVPFYFKVINCNKFLRKNAILRQTPAMKFLLDAAAMSGIGAGFVHTVQVLRRQARALSTDVLPVATEEIGRNDEDVDRVWGRVKERYRLIAVRDSKTIDILYPVTDKRFHRTKVFAGGTCIGWVVTLCTQMTSHKQFGTLRVGSIIDCLCHPDDAATIVAIAASGLEALGADIIVANHSHRAWGRAFGRNGFLRGPSNFIFGASAALAQRVGEFDIASKDIFFMRGDGDGPINL